MKLSDRDAFYEKMYFHEIAERDRLDDRFKTLLLVVGIVFTMISHLFNAIIIGSIEVPILFWVIYTVAVVSFCAAVTCYVKAWHSQYYHGFPALSDLEKYLEQIRQHYQKEAGGDEDTSALWTEQAFQEYMRQSFIDHTSSNTLANDNKRFWLYYGNSFIIGAFIFSVMAYFPVAQIFL